MIRIAVIVCALVMTGSAAAAGPTWVSGPDRAYNCTHYLDAPVDFKQPPRVAAGEAMKLLMRRDKVMKFTLAAKPVVKTVKRSSVAFELETPPAGAKLVGNKFEWKVAGAAGQRFDFALVAIGDDGGRTRWPLTVTVATDDLVTAWSAGMGSVWPDCDVYATGTYEVEDLDGDGKDDVIYKTYVGGDGTTETHVMLQRKSMKFVEAASCLTCHPSADVAADGTRLLITQDDCCCILSIGVQRFEGDSTAAVVAWQVPSSCHADPAEVTSITFTRDAKQRITGAEHTRADGKTERFRWRNKTFEKR